MDAASGVKLWNYTTGSNVDSSPAVVGGVVYIGSYDHNVYALNASSGAQIWNHTTTTRNGVFSSPAVVGGVVYVGSFDSKVYALNASSGAFIWSYTTGGAVSSSPAVVGGVVYVGSTEGNVYALNATDGVKLWSYTTSYYIVESSPAVVGGVVYVGAYDHNVYALNAASGAKLWNYTTGGIVYLSSPAVVGGVVYIGSYDGNVYALGTTYTVTVIQGANGVIAPGTTTVAQGGSQAFSITPNIGYHVLDVTVNGSSVGAVTSYTVSNVTGDTTISASFAINTYTITVTQGANGDIAPGTTVVAQGGSADFFATPNADYYIASITVDGSPVTVFSPTGQPFHFSNVQANHTITATYAINVYTITVTQTANGLISSGNGTSVNSGDGVSFSVTPSAGYHIASITTDAGSVTVTSPGGQTVDFSNVQANHTITATYAINVYTITVTQTANGLISSGNGTSVNSGDGVSFSVTPSAGYHIASITTDAGSVTVTSPGGQTVDFSNVQANHTITATYAINANTFTFTENGLPSGKSWSVTLGTTTQSSTTSMITFQVTTGSYSWSVQTPIGGGPDTRYVASQTSGTISVPGTASVNIVYTTLYRLTMSTNYGTVSPSSGWYPAGSMLTLSAVSPSTISGERYVFNGWTGTGSGSYTGISNPATNAVTMNAPVTETASWTHQFMVTFTQSGIGSDFAGAVVRIDGTSYAVSNLPASFWWTQGSAHTFQYLSPLTGTTFKYTLSSTTGSSSVGKTTIKNGVTTITVSGSGTITGNYAKT